MIDRTAEWERLRSRFNHDWLKNRFLLTVGSFLSSVSGDGYSVKEALEPLTDVMAQWPERRDRLSGILRDFEGTMSPATLLDSSPLDSLDAAARQWLGSLIHLLWWKGRGSEARRNAVEDACKRADEKYECLLARLNAADAERDIEGLERTAKEMYAEFRSLAEAIHRLPSKVEVV